MKWIEEFRSVLTQYDTSVFGMPSTICETKSEIDDIVAATSEVMFFNHKKEVLIGHPLTVFEGAYLHNQSFFLIQRPTFLERTYNEYYRRPKFPDQFTGVFFIDMATRMMIVKSIKKQIVRWGGLERFILGGGLFSSREIAEIIGSSTISVNEIEKKLRRSYNYHRAEFGNLFSHKTILQRETVDHAANVKAQIIVLLKCIKILQMSTDHKQSFAALRRITTMAHAPK
jgi:hypothetical protein